MSNIHKTIRHKTGTAVFLGMRMLPKAKREALYTLFAWARHIEDVVESSLNDKEKQEIINGWHLELDNIFDKKVPATEIGRRIYKNCLRFKLPKDEFINMLDIISKNVNTPLQAPTLKQLTGYCRGVGGMTGSLSLRVFGCSDEKIIGDLSNSMGTAVQITNILRNIKEDANNNRLYVPQELLLEAGITSTDPKTVLVDKNLAIARRNLAGIAAENYHLAYDVLSLLDKKTARPLRLILDIYKKYFDIMEKRGWEIISPKPEISKLRKLQILIKTMF
ncbi:MAG: squalene/phytoene synthase family protein [Alphaproteobacteria bacterium]|nr:squalene/phytoene synthase family protein [Alphaproteobacteria bacterium]MBR1649496.1 squalene/phytoene synthase family protein [Alphaproteobacteria bacterium]